MLDVSPEFLIHAATLMASAERTFDEDSPEGTVPVEGVTGSISKEDIMRIVLSVNNRKKNRLSFFNSTNGFTLRMTVHGHEPLLQKSLYSTLCGQHPGAKRGKGLCTNAHSVASIYV